MFTKTPSEILKDNINNKLVLSYNLRVAETFDNFDKLFDYVDIAENKCFYEVLSENIKRKMYFDIDIDDKSKLSNIDTFIYDVCGVIINILPDAYMLVTKSENNESPKCGIHIIIVNYFVENVYHAKRFYDNVYSYLPDNYKRFFDDKVYKSVQQFRLLFSSKINENRPKRYFKLIPTINVKVNKKMLLNLSMIQLIENDIGLEVLSIPEEKLFYIEPEINNHENVYYNNDDIIEQISDEKVFKILKLAKNYINLTSFSYHCTKGMFIILKRIRPSKCDFCKRIHEHENAFLYERNGNIFFGCRRSDNNNIVCAYNEDDIIDSFEIKDEQTKFNVEKIKKLNKEEVLKYFS